MHKANEYTQEQIADAEKMCKLISEIPTENRTFVSAFMLAYMNGIEVGMMYAQDAKAVTERLNTSLIV